MQIILIDFIDSIKPTAIYVVCCLSNLHNIKSINLINSKITCA